MSSLTATRTGRRSAPALPTRTAVPRRRTLGAGASVVGRADRAVLRIVAEDERAPVLTRITPEPLDVPIRRVALAEFFAPEYDGDDISLEVARPRRSALRLTRRGRLVVFVATLVAMLGIGVVAATGSLADDQPEPTRVVTVQPGQTLWDIASTSSRGGDVRSAMTHLEAINHLDGTALQVGQRLRVPQ